MGTDGCASNNRLDMFYEMDMCARVHMAKDRDPSALPAATALQLATFGGAGVLGLENVGSILPGKEADLILLNLNQPHLQPFHHPELLVYAASGGDVTTVIIGGRPVMLNRKILTLDVDGLMTRVRKLAEKL